MTDRICPHARTRMGRVICADGREHVAEVCLDCGQNARGSRWVPRHECREDPASLPVLKDLRSPEDRGEQPLLF